MGSDVILERTGKGDNESVVSKVRYNEKVTHKRWKEQPFDYLMVILQPSWFRRGLFYLLTNGQFLVFLLIISSRGSLFIDWSWVSPDPAFNMFYWIICKITF